MKIFCRNLAVLVILTGLASPAWSIVITGGAFDGTDVGSLDNFLGAGRTSSSLANELAFINLVAGTSYSAVEKVCGEEGLPDCSTYLSATDHNSSTFAFQTGEADAHFLVKTGNGSSLSGSFAGFECAAGSGSTACTSFVFANLASTSWGVFDLVNQLGFSARDINVTKVSHLTTPGGSVSVPEPATLSLLGLGLLGFGLSRRRRS